IEGRGIARQVRGHDDGRAAPDIARDLEPVHEPTRAADAYADTGGGDVAAVQYARDVRNAAPCVTDSNRDRWCRHLGDGELDPPAASVLIGVTCDFRYRRRDT